MSESVTLVIPARNAAAVLRPCLDAIVPMLQTQALAEILVVDDGSTDETATVLASYPVRRLSGTGLGAAAARNLGWQNAQTPFLWFVDADCVVEPETLARLLPHLDDPDVAGVGGTYTNRCPHSWLARLIGAEIAARHARMPREVNFLSTGNVLYRRSALEQVGGFDENYRLGHDVELAFRIRRAGHRLRMELASRVGHHHPTSLVEYLLKQFRTSAFRARLYREYPGSAGGDSYSGLSDHVQPPLALVAIATLPLAALGPWRLVPIVSGLLLLLVQAPITYRIVRMQRRPFYLTFAALGYIRAFIRGTGFVWGVIQQAGEAVLASRRRSG